jgi:hypothetical protein
MQPELIRQLLFLERRDRETRARLVSDSSLFGGYAPGSGSIWRMPLSWKRPWTTEGDGPSDRGLDRTAGGAPRPR